MHMTETRTHASPPCLDVAQQLQTVECALHNAKQALIHDHRDHCPDADDRHDRAELKAICRYL